jgi:hypothetical protein
MSGLSDEDLADMAESLELNADELKAIVADPDFAALVAEERAKL